MVTHAVLASVPTQLRPRRKATTEYPISSSSRIGEIQTSKQDRAKQELSSAIASTRDAALSGGAGRRLTKIVWRGAPADSSFPPRPPAPPPPSISSPMGGGGRSVKRREDSSGGRQRFALEIEKPCYCQENLPTRGSSCRPHLFSFCGNSENLNSKQSNLEETFV